MLKRLGNTVVSLVALVLGLALQLVFFAVLTGAAAGFLQMGGVKINAQLAIWLTTPLLVVGFNGLTCYQYFRRRKISANYVLSSAEYAVFHRVIIYTSKVIIYVVPWSIHRLFDGNPSRWSGNGAPDKHS